MKEFVETGLIRELKCGTNLSYILSREEDFLLTEYKVLQSQASHGFLKCMKMMYNGKIQLYYLSGGYKTLQELLFGLAADHFVIIMGNLLSTILEAKNNGFLSCQNIDLGLDHIFVDSATFQVYLIYLPLRNRLFDDAASFENELRTEIIKLIQNTPALINTKTAKLAEDLANGTLSLDHIERWLKGGKSHIPPLKHVQSNSIKNQRSLMLIAMDASLHLELMIDKEEYTLGKSMTQVDGVLSFNKMISRVHCKICKRKTDYYIIDLQSANGTFINKTRLFPNQEYPIRDGDVIRLANTDFKVVLREEMIR